MSIVARSSKAYLERAGIVATYRRPTPRINTTDHPVHRYPMAAPLPLPQYQLHHNGSPPPDAGLTGLWPS